MKMKFLRGTPCLAACLVIVFTCLLKAPAQPAEERKPDNRPPAGRPFPRGERPAGLQPGLLGGGQFMPLLQRVLTDEQRASLRDAMEEQREKSRELEDKMRVARRELLKVSLLDEFNEEAVRSKALEAARLEAELTVLRAKALSLMKPALSREQLEQLRNPPPFDGPGNRSDNPSRPPGRRFNGPRDENDLPAPPKPDK